MPRTDHLTRYREKRDFSKTREPEGIVASDSGNRYLVQKHEASHLHYDFRLELDGVLKSWAVPKGPSFDPHDKRLAMEVEDHPVAYGSFEGIIPEGEYGGGTVMLWDRGTWEPVGDPHEGLEKGKLVFRLHGERLTGEWTLVRFHGKEKSRKQWFLLKHRDEEIIEGDNGAFVAKHATSVASGRTMKAIAKDRDNVWLSKAATKKVDSAPLKKTRARKPATVKINSRAARADFPGFIPPQLATLTTTVPKGDTWVHEVKLDGYRMLAYIENGVVRLISRNGKDWTDAFKAVADSLAALPVRNAICDGEVVVVNADGKSSFSDLKNALSSGSVARMQYYAFDLLFSNETDLRALPFVERKQRLQALISGLPAKAQRKIHYSEHFTDEDGVFLQGVCGMGLEGVVSKRADAPYLSGRTKSWLKTKCIKREEFVIGGYTLPSNGSKGVGALLLGYYDADRFEYAGRVGTGWNTALSLTLRKKLEALAASKSPYESVTTEQKRGARWVKPQLVCALEFTEWTPDGHLRHPSFQGLREDKSATDVVRDFPEPVAMALREAEHEVLAAETPKKPAATRKVPAGELVFEDVAISHPDRVVFPESGITKGMVATYYASVADHILPHVKNRPLSVLRCPEGTGSACFFQRHVGTGREQHIRQVAVSVKGKDQAYMMIKDAKGLLSLAQWGVIELHPWQCSEHNLQKLDRMVFDLDPDPAVSWSHMIEAAHEVRDRMQELGLTSFLKTTGGKGLHVVVPMTAAYEWDTIKSFARAIADSMASDNPDRYLAKASKAARRGKIFVDYLRNDITSTAVAPFSVRARAGAAVSTPIHWQELTGKLSLTGFTMDAVVARLKKQKEDPWQEFFKIKQKIAAKYLRALAIEH